MKLGHDARKRLTKPSYRRVTLPIPSSPLFWGSAVRTERIRYSSRRSWANSFSCRVTVLLVLLLVLWLGFSFHFLFLKMHDVRKHADVLPDPEPWTLQTEDRPVPQQGNAVWWMINRFMGRWHHDTLVIWATNKQSGVMMEKGARSCKGFPENNTWWKQVFHSLNRFLRKTEVATSPINSALRRFVV